MPFVVESVKAVIKPLSYNSTLLLFKDHFMHLQSGTVLQDNVLIDLVSNK